MAGYILLAVFVIAKIVLQYLVVNPVYDLQRDEYLHLDQGYHLAWGYQSVPPVSSWISWLIIKLGNGLFWVKFFPAVFGALTIVTVWKAIEYLKGGLFACVLAATALLGSVLLRINILYQPNSLDILSWTLLYYCLLRYIQSAKNKYLYLLALAFAIGFLNKYNILFCLAGLLPALAISRHRRIFLIPHLYYAGLLALVLVSPNLYWQYQNHFPVLTHMKELAETQLVHVDRMDFLKEQLFFFIGSLFILLAGFISFFRYTPHKTFRLYFWAWVFTILVFIYLHAKAYYAIGLYPVYFAFGAVYLARLLSRGWLFYLRYVSIAVILVFFYMTLKVALPIYTPETYVNNAAEGRPFSTHTWEDGKQYPISQDFADMLGWKELAHKVDSVYASLIQKEQVMVLCDNYGQAGAINYYTKQKGLQADAFVPDYIRWMNLDRDITQVIRIKTASNTDSKRDENLFNSVHFITEIDNIYAREKGTRILLLRDPKMELAPLLRNERDKRTAR
ncbi:MAG: glycosyltransferase family 39 protein [Chitinophagaceae bacterium]|nr:MAG: glycosyltransferase family 39 protein [Chitinophagaceae bacterium]